MVKEQYRLIVGWLGVYALDLLKAIFFPTQRTFGDVYLISSTQRWGT